MAVFYHQLAEILKDSAVGSREPTRAGPTPHATALQPLSYTSATPLLSLPSLEFLFSGSHHNLSEVSVLCLFYTVDTGNNRAYPPPPP